MMSPVLKKLTTQSGLVGGVFLAAFFVAVLPKWMAVRQLSTEVHKNFRDNQALQTLILTVNNSGNRLEVIQKKVREYKKKVLRQEDLTKVLDEIGSQAPALHLNVLSLQALNEPRQLPGQAFIDEGLEVQQIRIVLKAEGQYQDIRNYLKQLEAMPYQVRVQTILLKNTSAGVIKEENKEPLLSMEVTLGVLMRLPKLKAAASPGGHL